MKSVYTQFYSNSDRLGEKFIYEKMVRPLKAQDIHYWPFHKY